MSTQTRSRPKSSQSKALHNGNAQCLVYKKVVNKVYPVPGTIHKGIRIIQQFLEDPLRMLPHISPYPPAFLLGVHLTRERMEELGLLKNEFLWPEKRRLVAQVLLVNEKGLV